MWCDRQDGEGEGREPPSCGAESKWSPSRFGVACVMTRTTFLGTAWFVLRATSSAMGRRMSVALRVVLEYSSSLEISTSRILKVLEATLAIICVTSQCLCVLWVNTTEMINEATQSYNECHRLSFIEVATFARLQDVARPVLTPLRQRRGRRDL